MILQRLTLPYFFSSMRLTCCHYLPSILLLLLITITKNVVSFSWTTPSFFGRVIVNYPSNGASWTMRKQKASDRRTRRLQKTGSSTIDPTTSATSAIQQRDSSFVMTSTTKTTFTTSPMQSVQSWSIRKSSVQPVTTRVKAGGRNRSRKRSTLYNSLSSYHTHFMRLLTDEYKAEVSLHVHTN
jgi:hypothetical protein